MMKNILVTGAAGFIGFHLCKRLLSEGRTVVGIDSMTDYYDIRLKRDRLARISSDPHFRFLEIDIADREAMAKFFETERFDAVVNLAGQVSVRYSLKKPYTYLDSNVTGFLNILEGCRHNGVRHLVFASSSSVYGANTRMPYSVHHNVDHPISLYAATKKSNELMAHAYAALYKIPCTGLRFFTVYGPWGRPDMSYFLFTKAILEGRPIDVFNYGDMKRDFTFVDDIVEGVARIVDRLPSPDPAWSGDRPDAATSFAPYRLYNIGNNQPVELGVMIDTLERHLGKKAVRNLLPLQPGDVLATYADVDDLAQDVGFRPATTLDAGLKQFVDWYRSYYGN